MAFARPLLPAPSAASPATADHAAVHVPTKRERAKTARLRELARLRYLQRLTVEECATRLGRSERSIYYDLADPTYGLEFEAMRKEWTEQSRAELQDLSREAIATLRDLMGPATRSEHVRFEAAAKVADLAGVQVQLESAEHDDRAEVLRIQEIINERARTQVAAGFEQLVRLIQPGGFLPRGQVSAAGLALEAYAGVDNTGVVEAAGVRTLASEEED